MRFADLDSTVRIAHGAHPTDADQAALHAETNAVRIVGELSLEGFVLDSASTVITYDHGNTYHLVLVTMVFKARK
jgi:hypothetical protein